MFLAFVPERGARNESWDDLDYDPAKSIMSKIDTPLSDLKKQSDRYKQHRSVFSFYSPDTYDSAHSVPVGEFASNSSNSGVWELSADAVVIGSGTGGGTVAAELVAAGKDVIVLEKGGYFRQDDFAQVSRGHTTYLHR